MDTFVQDLRQALRRLWHSPGFTVIAVVTLALGIGANTAIFSLIDAIILRSLPVRDLNRLVLLGWNSREGPKIGGLMGSADCGGSDDVTSGCTFSAPFLKDLRSQRNMFAGFAAFSEAGRLVVRANGGASTANGEYVSGDYFQALGVISELGRTFNFGDDEASATPVVVLNYRYWQKSTGSDRSVIGKIITLNGVPATVVGVAEQRFTNLIPGSIPDLWLPLAMEPRIPPTIRRNFPAQLNDPRDWWITIVGRLKPGISRFQAQVGTNLLFRNEMLHGKPAVWATTDEPALTLKPVQTGLTGSRTGFARPLYLVMLAVAIVLLIACANVAGLALARAMPRQKEMAMRMALGARRSRIVRQLITESILLSLSGGAVGVVFAFWGSRAVAAFISSWSSQPLSITPEINLRVLLFTGFVSVLAGVLSGLAPAFHCIDSGLASALKERFGSDTSRSGRPRRFNTASLLVIFQVTLTVVILVAAGLVARTLENLENIDPGFDANNVLLFGVDSTLSVYQGARIGELYSELQTRLSKVPGVTSSTYSENAILSGELFPSSMSYQPPGSAGVSRLEADRFPVGPKFFETMRLPMMAGRGFMATDFVSIPPGKPRAASSIAMPPAPIIVNETLVHRYFGHANPVGQIIGSGAHFPGMEIIGVAHDARLATLRADLAPTYYLPIGRSDGAPGGQLDGYFELRTAGNPLVIVPAVRSMLKQVDSNLVIYDLKTESRQVDQGLFEERLIARISGFFGVLALLLACIGLYGLLLFRVTRSTQEIGVRLALGARQSDVVRNVVAQAVTLTFIGVAIGLVSSLVMMRFLGSVLYGVRADDPITFVSVVLVLLLVSFVASYIPARRAAKVHPMMALRYE